MAMSFSCLSQSKQEHMVDFSDESCDSDSDVENEDTDKAASLERSLREYQKELAENALDGQNTIIYAPAGSGKTRVATYILLKHLETQSENKPEKSVAFLARTIPLVMQQYNSLKKYLPSKYMVENITSFSKYSNCLHKLVNLYNVFVMTPSILENHVIGENPLIENGLAAFSLLIFDECHHTRKNETYYKLMLRYLHTKEKYPNKLPQIVGLTASIGVENAANDPEADKSVMRICGHLDAVSISNVKRNEEELNKEVPFPEEENMRLEERTKSKVHQKLQKVLQKLQKCLKSYSTDIDDKELKRIVEECSLEKSSQKYLDWIARIEKRAKAIKGSQKPDQLYCIITIAKHMKAYNAAFEINSLARPCDVSNFLNERLKNCDDTKETCESYEKLKKTLDESKDTSNPNLETMKTLIKKNLVDKQEVDTKKSKGIIFVPTRFLAHALASWLNDCKDESLELLQASAFTGSQASGDKGGMTSSQQDSTLMKFRSGETKLLVATSFTEEGIDIPECSLVIRYNHVGNEVNTVQMRGRSRKKGGKSVLLACETLYIRESINQFNADLMEKAVKKVSKMDPREISKSNEVIQKEMLQNDKIKINNKFSKGPLRDEQFKMVCNRCKQTVIESKDIRLIDECHRIAISRQFMLQGGFRDNGALQDSEQLTENGKAKCPGKPEMKIQCGNHLGSQMMFRKIPFIVLSLRSFGFERAKSSDLCFYKNWKDVPYHIKEIQMDDINCFLSSDWENPDESDETRNHENEVTQVTDFQQDQPNVEPDGKRPTSEESSGSGTAAKCEASVNASNSITEVKSVTAGSSSAHKDSGFMTISTRQNGRGADDETVIHLEETDNEILNSEECNETVSTGLDNVHKEIKQNEQQQHMSETDFTLSNAVQEMDQPLSNISTFNPPNIKEGIDTLEDSFSRPEISITSDKDED